MKVLLLLGLLWCGVISQGATYQVEGCRTRLLRSYGFAGLATPNDSNALCPSITANCCTPIDQMAMHKLWNKHSKPHLEKVYKANLEAFNALEPILGQRSTLALANVTDYFRNKTEANDLLKQALSDLHRRFNSTSRESLLKDFDDLKRNETLKTLYATSSGLRQGLLCALCDAKNGQFLSAESGEAVYANSFCSTLVSNFSLPLGNQWANIMSYLLLLDDFAIVASGKGLFPPAAKNAARSAQSAARKCVRSSCSDFCSEFSINKLSPIFDGFGDPIRAWIENYKATFGTLLPDDPRTFATFVAFRLEETDPLKVEAAKKRDPDFSAKDANFWAGVKKQSLARSRDQIDVGAYARLARVEGTASEEESSGFSLFQTAPPPIELSSLKLRYGDSGLDLFRDSAELNFDLSSDQLLRMFVITDVSVTLAQEQIHQIVKDTVLQTPVAEIKGFLGDLFLDYDKFIEPEVLLSAAMPPM